MTTTDTETQGLSLDKAKILSEALPYMRRYANLTVVVKYGGHAMGQESLALSFARDVVLLKQVGMNPVVVHGGGPQISNMLERLQIQSQFVEGQRVTDPASMEVVEMVLSGTINKQIVSAITEAGGRAVGLSGKDCGLIRAERLRKVKKDPETGAERVLDLGLVGEPKEIDPHVLNVLKASDIIPVVAPVGVGPANETLNINADTVSGSVAGALKATRLLLLTDVAGVLDADGKLISELTIADVDRLIASGVIKGGMIPKVRTCVAAVRAGVEAAVIVDGRVPHAILIEMFTEGGAGTLIRAA